MQVTTTDVGAACDTLWTLCVRFAILTNSEAIKYAYGH